MNKQQNSTVAASPAMPDFKQAFLDLEDLISAVRRPVRTLDFLITSSDQLRENAKEGRVIGAEEFDAFYDTSFTAREAVSTLEDRWNETYGALCAFEHHSTNGFRDISNLTPQPDPLLALIRSYEAGMVAYNGRSDEGEEAVRATYGPSFDALMGEAVPRPTTMEGALAALRLLVKEGDVILDGQMVAKVLPAVLGFLEGKAA